MAVSILIMVLVPCELPLNRALPDDVGKMETLGGAACVKVGTCTSTRTYKHKHMHMHMHMTTTTTKKQKEKQDKREKI